MFTRSTRLRTGFTLVELLIVIVVIAILAAITIVAYNGIQNRANNAAVQSDMEAIVKKMEMYKIENGNYPVNIAAINTISGFHLTNSAYDTTNNNVYYYYDATHDIYAFGMRTKALEGYMVVNGKVSDVGSGGVAGVSGAATAQAITNAGGAYTYGSTWYISGTGWNSSVSWAI